ncbi:MAG: hypothetical protein KJN62_07670 [Deltaproteobacteria bacterium]|nr:hypothetical protein [Deltaproteobacteria bacterium]
MKKLLIIFCAVCCVSSVAFADEVERGLSTMASEQIKVSARQMITTGMNSDNVIKMTRHMIHHQFSQQTTLRAHEIIMRAQKEKLPVEPIMNKAYEGIAKGVQARNIVKAMETVRSRFAFSYQRSKELTHEENRVRSMGKTMAESLSAGLKEKDMDALMDRLRERTRDMKQDQTCELAEETFKTAREMARFGVSSEVTSGMIGQALRNRYNVKEMEHIRNMFTTRSQYSNAENLAKNLSAQIGRGENTGNISSSGKGDAGGTGGSGSSGGGSGSGSGGGTGSGSGSGNGSGR